MNFIKGHGKRKCPVKMFFTTNQQGNFFNIPYAGTTKVSNAQLRSGLFKELTFKSAYSCGC